MARECSQQKGGKSMTFTIIFIGLIAHLRYTPGNEPTRNVAVLVKAANHVAELIVPPGAEIPTTSRSHFSVLTTDADGTIHYDISNHALTFVGLPSGRVVRTSRFNSEVPKLADVSGKTMLDSTYVVPEKLAGGPVTTFVDLPLGTLDVAGYYPSGAVHSLAGRKVCVACSTQFTATVPGDSVEIVSDTGQHLLLNGDAVITIRNLKTGGTEPDYSTFATLMQGGASAGSWNICSSTPCDCTKMPRCPAMSAATLECSATSFP